MAHSAVDVAYHILKAARGKNKQLTPMQLIKLVYIAHGWTLAITGDPLISEPIQAWDYGPVVPSVYHEFKIYGRDEIDDIPRGYRDVHLMPEEKNIIDRVLDTYGDLPGSALSNMTHEDGTPWQIIFQQNNNCLPRFARIPNELIEKHYRDLARENAKKRLSSQQ